MKIKYQKFHVTYIVSVGGTFSQSPPLSRTEWTDKKFQEYRKKGYGRRDADRKAHQAWEDFQAEKREAAQTFFKKNIHRPASTSEQNSLSFAHGAGVPAP